MDVPSYRSGYTIVDRYEGFPTEWFRGKSWDGVEVRFQDGFEVCCLEGFEVEDVRWIRSKVGLMGSSISSADGYEVGFTSWIRSTTT